MSGKIEKTCPCGAVFVVYKSQYKQKRYCRADCESKPINYYVTNTCELCETSFRRPKNWGTGRFCSDSCRKVWFSSAFRGKDSPNWKGGITGSSAYYSKRRRAAMYAGDRIDRVEVFNHYGWICHLCNKDIDKSLSFPDKMAATLDHVIPLSRGGLHVWDNVAPAHAICNERKGARVDAAPQNSMDSDTTVGPPA